MTTRSDAYAYSMEPTLRLAAPLPSPAGGLPVWTSVDTVDPLRLIAAARLHRPVIMADGRTGKLIGWNPNRVRVEFTRTRARATVRNVIGVDLGDNPQVEVEGSE